MSKLDDICFEMTNTIDSYSQMDESEIMEYKQQIKDLMLELYDPNEYDFRQKVEEL